MASSNFDANMKGKEETTSTTPDGFTPQTNTSDLLAGDILIAPSLNISDLFQGTTVKVLVSSDQEALTVTFAVPKALVCGYSAYFSRVFNGRFVEATTQEARIFDTKPQTFKIFVAWMYTRKLCHLTYPEYDNSLWEIEELFEDLSVDDAKTVNRGQHPVSWRWSSLFALYIFGDKYDSRLLRNSVMEKVQMKAFSTSPKYSLPTPADIAYAVENLHSSSTLYRFLVQLCTREVKARWFKGQLEWFLLPPNFAAELFEGHQRRIAAVECRACGPLQTGSCLEIDHTSADRKKFDSEDWCEFHEHDAGHKDEVTVCKKRLLLITEGLIFN